MNLEQIENALNSFSVPYKLISDKIKGSEVTVRTCFVRASDETLDDSCKKWIKKFSELTSTEWIVERTYNNLKQLEYRKDFVCQHSDKNKTRKKETTRNRNKKCTAKIVVKVKKSNKDSRYRDAYLKEGLDTMIVVNFHHSHRTNVAEAFSFLRVSSKTRDLFTQYFEDSMSPSEAKAFHRASLMAATPVDKLVEVLANAQINPTDRSIYDMFEKWRKRNYGDRSSKSIVEKLREKASDLDTKGFKLSVQAEPFCCVILTPIMLRAHQLPFSNDIVFVDSSGSCDQGGSVVTFLFGASKIGGVPLGCIIHYEQNEHVYESCFRKLKELIGNEGFYGKRYPSVFMTDDSAAERNALRKVFPDSALLLCSFHVMQTVWRWLWNSEHQIAKEDRRTLMLYFRDVLYAKEEIDCELFKEALCESEISRKYLNFLEYFDKMWQRRQEWCHYFRKKLCTRGHNTNNMVEVSIRLFKDLVLQRCKAFNAASLVDFICLSLEEFYKEKLLRHASSRDNKLIIYFTKFCKKLFDLRVVKVSEYQFTVTSASDETLLYQVNTRLEVCDCPEGSGGQFCKHLCAVYNTGAQMYNVPNILLQDKIELATLALGNNVSDPNFFKEMDKGKDEEITTDFNEPMTLAMADDLNETARHQENDVSIEVHETETHELAEIEEFKSNLENIGSFAESHPALLPIVKKFNRQMKKMDSEASFYALCSSFTHQKKSRKINVQPTSIARRISTYRGAKAMQAGRPSNTEIISRKRPRKKRSLMANILQNTTNALSHGSAH